MPVSTRRQKHHQIHQPLMNQKNRPNPGPPKNQQEPPPGTQPEHQDSTNISNEESLKEKLQTLYTDITSAPSYSAKIAEFLRENDVHGVYRRVVKKKFPRRRVIARFPFEIFMGDLLEYPNYKTSNHGYKFILILIDCFTKKLYAAPMKRKDADRSAEAFNLIFNKMDRFPINLVTDGGKEFFNKEVRKIFDNYDINHYRCPTKTKTKASVAERVIRTLKTKFERYFYKTKTHNWADVLDQFVQNYNSVPHSAHGFPPQDVSDENREIVYKRLYPNKDLTVVCKLKIGDKVRKIREKEDFEKGYTVNWSEEIYKIYKVFQSNEVCWYKLEALDGRKLQGIWYYYQLNLVSRSARQYAHQPKGNSS